MQKILDAAFCIFTAAIHSAQFLMDHLWMQICGLILVALACWYLAMNFI